MLRNILPLFILLTAFIHIKAKYEPSKTKEYIFKPLTTILITVVALLGSNPGGNYKYLIITGLIFSLAGDIFLMLEHKFIHGLVSFLIAHIFYIVAFNDYSGITELRYGPPKWQLLLPFIIYGILIYQYLSANLGKLKIPVIFYISVILIMGVSALNRYIQINNASSFYALAGALIFIISDTILSINRFKLKFIQAEFLLLTTYYTAQLLIAFSIR